MAKKPSITLVVVFHNEEKNLPKLLESFSHSFAEDTLPDFNFLFIDNCSSDASVPLLQKWLEKNKNFKARVYSRTENHLAEARTQAIQKTETDWLAFVDADATLRELWPKHALFVANDMAANVVAVGGLAEYMGSRPWHHFAKAIANYFPMGRNQSQRVEVRHAPTNNYLLKRQAGLEIGGFDSFFNRVGEDLEFNVRLLKKGKIFYDPLFAVDHALPEEISVWYRKMALYGRAQSFVFLKHRGGVPSEKFIPLLSCIALNLSLFVFPLISFVSLSFFLMLPRTRFFLLSFLFYGLGELVGFFKYFYLQINLGSSANQTHKVP